ncbi:hypothetical protein TEA_009431 [Camellia sinensis var. sinensis]|uniref:Uncharacterized protein n=1 Tax=Camellia sinensis var. sinensis TaxID=542762 RepID=A0A4S4ETS6_CAMSN|nr:hypothetical protein TEA_009431 [Camellia sinensis var. sinensis]
MVNFLGSIWDWVLVIDGGGGKVGGLRWMVGEGRLGWPLCLKFGLVNNANGAVELHGRVSSGEEEKEDLEEEKEVIESKHTRLFLINPRDSLNSALSRSTTTTQNLPPVAPLLLFSSKSAAAEYLIVSFRRRRRTEAAAAEQLSLPVASRKWICVVNGQVEPRPGVLRLMDEARLLDMTLHSSWGCSELIDSLAKLVGLCTAICYMAIWVGYTDVHLIFGVSKTLEHVQLSRES